MSIPIFADTDDVQESSFLKSRCCFCFPFVNAETSPSGYGSSFWQRINPPESSSHSSAYPDSSSLGDGELWWQGRWRKMREWLEIIAGPKWKTFVRRICQKRGREWNGKFHYDPVSYSLNFDDGPGQNGHYDEDLLDRGFYSRFSLAPVSAKSSIDSITTVDRGPFYT